MGNYFSVTKVYQATVAAANLHQRHGGISRVVGAAPVGLTVVAV
jgi:hypothetical protein